jgi:hypothetical protein
MLIKIKKFILNIPYYLFVALQLHSKAPNREIKKIWEIFMLGGLPVVLLTLFCGEKIFIFFSLPKIDYINNYGSWIFWVFVVVFCAVFFNYEKSNEISKNIHEKYNKS